MRRRQPGRGGHDPQTFVVKAPNTALIYFLGTIGPYLLVILIVCRHKIEPAADAAPAGA